jgi:hypothetical protein
MKRQRQDDDLHALIETKKFQQVVEKIRTFSQEELMERFTPHQRCLLFLHCGLVGEMDLCESLAGTVDLSSDDMTDAVVDVLVRDRIAQATKSGLVAGLIRNGAADDVVSRTRAGLLEVATRCLNDIVAALGERASNKPAVELPKAAVEEISAFLGNVPASSG